VFQINKLKNLGQISAPVSLLLTMLGPWFIDTHPATAETCSPPLVWLGNGYCACFVSFTAAFRMAFSSGHHMLWLLFLPIGLPFLSTAYLLFVGERRRLWVFHLTALGGCGDLYAVYVLRKVVYTPGSDHLGGRTGWSGSSRHTGRRNSGR
jgi:hypothetical protein